MAIVKTSDTSFDKDVLKSDKPVLVDFWAEWCGPCKMIAPPRGYGHRTGRQVQVVKVNIDDNPLTPTSYGVRGIPTLMLFKNGEVTATKVGPCRRASWSSGCRRTSDPDPSGPAAASVAGWDPSALTAAKAFLAEHPLTESVDLLLPDLNGILRGKRLCADQLAGALAGECFFTISLYALDSTGTNVDRSGIVWEQGDPDRPVVLDPDTLKPVPWRPGGAQVLGGLLDADGTPFFADPRHLLRTVAGRFAELGLTHVAALELEFHLLAPDLDLAGRPSVAPCHRLGGPGREVEVFLPDRLEDQERFFALVEEYAAAQDVRSSPRSPSTRPASTS